MVKAPQSGLGLDGPVGKLEGRVDALSGQVSRIDSYVEKLAEIVTDLRTKFSWAAGASAATVGIIIVVSGLLISKLNSFIAKQGITLGANSWLSDTAIGNFDVKCEYRWQINKNFGSQNSYGIRPSGPYVFYATVVTPSMIGTRYHDRNFYIYGSDHSKMKTIVVKPDEVETEFPEVSIEKRCGVARQSG